MKVLAKEVWLENGTVYQSDVIVFDSRRLLSGVKALAKVKRGEKATTTRDAARGIEAQLRRDGLAK